MSSKKSVSASKRPSRREISAVVIPKSIPARKGSNTTIQMPFPYLKAWLWGLRHGGYIQGKGRLYNPQTAGFCCLGVLQHVVTGGEVEVSSDGHFQNFPSVEWLKEHGIKFRYDSVSSALNCVNPRLPTLAATAGYANDSLCKSFAEIADAIEACAEGY